jgi:general secretion pathway protein K
VALLVALLVMALATLSIAALLTNGELTAARARNQLRVIQAQAYAAGLEAYAAHILLDDQASGDSIDTVDDRWGIPLPPTPVPGGEIAATLRDLDGRFNLNNLAPLASNPHAAEWKERFVLLLRALKLDPALADAVVDWLDPSPAAAGSDTWYLAQPVPYRAARRMFQHVSELRLVRGVSGAVYAVLAPHVAALPLGTRINVNTATVPVLMTLSSANPLTQQQAQALWQQGHARYRQIPQDLLALVPDLRFDCVACFGVQSSYFLAHGEITLDGLPFVFYSVIERRVGGANAGIHVLQRSRGDE